MPDPQRRPFSYAILRVVPRIERGERFNAGVVALLPPARLPRRFGSALDERRLTALAPDRRARRGRAASRCARPRRRRRPDAPARSRRCPRRSGSAGSSRRRARSSSPPRCTPGSPTIRRRRSTSCSPSSLVRWMLLHRRHDPCPADFEPPYAPAPRCRAPAALDHDATSGMSWRMRLPAADRLDQRRIAVGFASPDVGPGAWLVEAWRPPPRPRSGCGRRCARRAGGTGAGARRHPGVVQRAAPRPDALRTGRVRGDLRAVRPP